MAIQTILIIDDEVGMREGLAETVVDLGYRALTSSSGREGLAKLRSDAPDAVLLDLRMAGEFDGLDTLKAIRTMSAPPPTTILTAYATAENTIEAMRLGAFDHLTKPIGRADLADVLARMLALRALEAAGTKGQSNADATLPLTLVGASDGMSTLR